MTLDGKAVGPGTITFASKSGGGNPATSAIESNGGYQLKTSRAAGLHSGKYQVCIVVQERPKGQPGERIYGVPKMITPEKYSSMETSGLEFEIKPGGNTINIDLPSK